jgi:Protein of unknown function (DUF2911)
MRLFINFIFVLLIITLLACSSKKGNDEQHGHTGHPATAKNYADSVNTGIIPKDTLKGSTIRMAMTFIGDNHVHIQYGSPGVRERVIWGGLVAYDQIWSTGAHNATSIEFSKDIIVADKTIPAGKYGFFTIPGKDTWTLILNKKWDQHLADNYKESDDVVRIVVKPELMNEVVQRLTYTVIKTSDTEGTIVMQWEKIRVALPFKNTN